MTPPLPHSRLPPLSLSFSLRVAFAVVLLVVAACGKKTLATSGAPRVVSLSPSTTEAMFAIGAGRMLVGRSTFCDYPPEVLSLPVVGGYTDPNLEAILALRPTLVIGARGPAGPGFVDKLEAMGVKTFFPKTESFREIREMIFELGVRTGHKKESDAVIDAQTLAQDHLRHALMNEPRKKVLLVFGISPLIVAGPESFPDEMLRNAGATNAVTQGSGYPRIDIEMVKTLDPDVILNAAMAETGAQGAISKEADGWRDIRAVREGNVAEVSDVAALRPGPRIMLGVESLARAIYPRAFAR